jgi:hypothetical protein
VKYIHRKIENALIFMSPYNLANFFEVRTRAKMLTFLIFVSFSQVYSLSNWGMISQILNTDDTLVIDATRGPAFIRVNPYLLPGNLIVEFVPRTSPATSFTHRAQAGERLAFSEGTLTITYQKAVAPCQLTAWLTTWRCGLATIHSRNPRSLTIDASEPSDMTPLCYLLELPANYPVNFNAHETGTSVMFMDGDIFEWDAVAIGPSVRSLGTLFAISSRTGNFSASIDGSSFKMDWGDEDGIFLDCSKSGCVESP